MFLPLKSLGLPSVSSTSPVAQGLFGLQSIQPSHCVLVNHLFTSPPEPVYPTRLSYCLISQSLRYVCANLSVVSTSKQKRLSMDSVLRRMQDFSVSCVGPCRERRKKLESARLCVMGQQNKQSEDINCLQILWMSSIQYYRNRICSNNNNNEQ